MVAPVTLITGHLGSGKTTLVNALSSAPGCPRLAIVINEFGDTPLDQHFVGAASEDVTVLPNGCLCCKVRGDLGLALLDLAARRSASYDAVVIETSGLASPGPVLSMLIHDPGLAAHYRLNGVITLVDAMHGERVLATSPEAREQAAAADRILMSKIDLVEPDHLERSEAAARRLTPAPIWRYRPDPAQAFNLSLFDAAAQTFRPGRWLPAGSQDHVHADDISTITLRADRPVGVEETAGWLAMLARALGPDLLRLKGILRSSENSPNLLAVHGVHGFIHAPVQLPDSVGWPHEGRIVVIARGPLSALLQSLVPLSPGFRI